VLFSSLCTYPDYLWWIFDNESDKLVGSLVATSCNEKSVYTLDDCQEYILPDKFCSYLLDSSETILCSEM
jgi:hypothetical protein